MITRLTIGNFKSISGTVNIDIRPLTLLFGPNGAGKTTVFHAIHYLRRILSRGNLDHGLLLDGPGTPDIGGFGDLVYGHDVRREMVLGVEFELPEQLRHENFVPEGVDRNPLLKCLWGHIHRAGVTFTLHHTKNGADIKEVAFSINDEPLALAGDWGGNILHTRHPLFATGAALGQVPSWFEDILRSLCGDDFDATTGNAACWFFHRIFTHRTASGAERADIEFDDRLTIKTARNHDENMAANNRTANDVCDLVAMEPLRQLQLWLLSSFSHIGPLRHVVAGHRLLEKATGSGPWYTGEAAWDLLLQRQYSTSLLNHFLGSECLDLGLSVQTTAYRTFEDRWDLLPAGEQWSWDDWDRLPDDERRKWLDSHLSDVAPHDPKHFARLLYALAYGAKSMKIATLRTKVEELYRAMRDLPQTVKAIITDARTGVQVEPEHLAVGVSQAIPVVIACLAHDEARFLAVEQPELHVHPKVQCAMGDVLAAAIYPMTDSDQMMRLRRALVETHSEHLLLRLLRRVRETTEQHLPHHAFPVDPDDIAVIYVEPANPQAGGPGTRIRRLRIDNRGEFLDPWPQGFFEERGEELFG